MCTTDVTRKPNVCVAAHRCLQVTGNANFCVFIAFVYVNDARDYTIQ